MVKKLQLANLIIIAIVFIIFLICFSSFGIWEIIDSIKFGDNDYLELGIPFLIGLIISGIYLFLGIKVYKSDRELNKLLKISYWINVISFSFLSLLVLFMFILAIISPKYLNIMGFVFLLFITAFLQIISILIDFVLFIIGYIKFTKEQRK
jgi:hypothetical protein